MPRIADAVAWAAGWAGRHRRLLVACAAARDRILAGAQVDPSRVFLVEGGERAGKEKGARADFTLR